MSNASTLQASTLPTVRQVSFDLGGTLLQPHPGVGAVYAEVLSECGITVQPAMLESRFREAFREASLRPRARVSEDAERAFWREILAVVMDRLVPEEQMPSLLELLWNTFAEGRRWRVRADAVPVMRILRARGYRLVAFSNSDSRFHCVVREVGLAPFFDHVFISSELGSEKPHPAAFRAVETASGYAGEAILHIGDSIHHDIDGAELAGWHARLLIADDGRPAPAGHAPIRSLAELLDLLPGFA